MSIGEIKKDPLLRIFFDIGEGLLCGFIHKAKSSDLTNGQ